jgi:hypothetical protein
VNAANVYNGAFWNWNNTAYTDNTTESNSYGGSAFNFIATTSSYAYIGSAVPFYNITADVGTAGAGYTRAFQYYNGSTWTAFTPATDGTNAMAQDGTIYWDNLAGWAALAFSASVPHNAAEIARLTGREPLATLPHVADIATRAAILRSRLSGKIHF